MRVFQVSAPSSTGIFLARIKWQTSERGQTKESGSRLRTNVEKVGYFGNGNP